MTRTALTTPGALAATLFLPLCGWAQSAWLPSSGQFLATPGFTYSTFDEFWVGRDRVDPLAQNDESLDQYTGFVTMEYGLSDRWAADLTLGYTATSETETFGNDGDEGMADTTLGLRYRLTDPAPWVPVLTLRVGGTIAGTYDENTPFSAGDGADAFESSLLIGHSFGDTGLGLYGDFGYRIRSSDVPDEIFGSGGLFYQSPPVFAESDAFVASVGYRHLQSLSGLDIGGPGFDPSLGAEHGFPALREISQLVEGSLGYTDSGGRQYQFTVAKSVDGRNTGDKLIFLFAVTLPFGGR
jgi:hypothetical protein